MLKSLFRKRPSATVGDGLYAQAVAQARQPAFYADLGVADRIDARFELYTLHVLLLVMRLRDEGEQGAEIAQTLFDTYVSALDNSLRELGVGDLSISKKMRKLAESLYGRMSAYEGPIRAGDRDALSAAIARNFHETDQAANGRPLADYVLAAREGLKEQDVGSIRRGATWPEVVA